MQPAGAGRLRGAVHRRDLHAAAPILLGALAGLAVTAASGQTPATQTPPAQPPGTPPPGAQTQATQNTQQQTIETVVVVGVTPLPDRGLPQALVPANVTFATGEDIERLHPIDLTHYLNRAATSVSFAEAQDNPLQPDLQFRGFTGSPLLGLPQGIVVYQDGVRINEPFGDTVNWAVLPQAAIDTVTLMPGSNPTFGMNALGGALLVTTKDGFDHPGARVDVNGGSFGRVNLQAQVGGQATPQLAYFAAVSYFDEQGWRDFSPSRSGQLFGDLHYRTDESSLALSVTWADTRLIGNGPSPVQLLQLDRAAIFTRPDQTDNNMTLVNLNGRRQLSPLWRLIGIVYYRHSKIDTLNGDDSPFEPCGDGDDADADDDDGGGDDADDDDSQAVLCDALGVPVVDQNGDEVPDLPEFSGATLNRSETEQEGAGASFQAGADWLLWDRPNHFIVGASYDGAWVGFRFSTELGELDATRNAIGSGVFAAEAAIDLKSITNSYGVFFTDTYEVLPTLSVNVAGRYNNTSIGLRDQLGTQLSGHHSFSRFNPAAGITYRPLKELQLYASYGEATRVPSPVELTCSDPTAPCRLPNAFLSDPPLQQVVSHTWEVGLRGDIEKIHWHVGAFHSINDNDIIFVSAGVLTNQGFFTNVGQTRREGIELNLSGKALNKRLSWFANYTLQSATFQENLTVPSFNNPEAVNGEIPVESGDHIPSIPDQIFKIGFDFAITPHWSVGGDLNAASGQFLRGDEGNLTPQIPGYAVLNLRAAYTLNEHFTAYVLISNVFDHDYETFGVFGEPEPALGPAFNNPRFLSPAAPIGAWVGVRLALQVPR
jgi:iron complex outermembrane recepter protein